MPIFEFHCPVCDRVFEKILKTPLAETRCPECGKMAARKVSAIAAAPDPGCTAPAGSGFR